MDLTHYAEMVYFQFYRKVAEIDFFIEEAIDNARKYRIAPAPKENFYFDKMQFTFSAFINANVSCWEICKLSISLRNQLESRPAREGLASEYKLENDSNHFLDYFSESSEQAYDWFKFSKSARNANSHDGSLSLNGGNFQQFLFQTDLHRYKFDMRSKKFIYEHSKSPGTDAISTMLDVAIQLIPLYESKLQKPTITLDQHYEAAKFKIASVKGFIDTFKDQEKSIIEAMVNAQLQGPKEMNCLNQINKWKNHRIEVV